MNFFRLICTILVVLPMAVLTSSSSIASVKVKTELGRSVLVKNQKQKAYIRVHLEGIRPEKKESRPPVNIAIVIDKSGSMSGAKIDRAKDAAIMAIERLEGNDIVSIVTYDNRINVIVPATKVSEKEAIKERIDSLRAGGSTALYGGTVQGIKEVRKFLSNNQVNRVILISDGLANVGPSSPEALGELGKSAGKDGIAVTTIGLGLGYNEDLMTKLAFNSDGNHAFAKNAEDLIAIFNNEFGDVLSVVAQDVEVEIIFHEKIKPIRSLGREVIIEKNTVRLRLNQIYASQQKEVILEVEAPEGLTADQLRVADIKVRYLNMNTKSKDKQDQVIEAKLVDTKKEWEASTNKAVMTSVATQIAVKENERALKLRDKGKVKEAQKVLRDNAAYLRNAGAQYNSKDLENLAKTNAEEAQNLEGRNWSSTRKLMRARQHKSKTQQKY